MAGKAARGAGTIRKKTVTRSGKTYTYWEARVTTGRDPGTGKQVQISITGKTQKEVREKMQAAAVAVDSGTYIQPERMTVSEWLDIWTAEYLGGVKPNTVRIYRNNVKKHIKPALGAVRLPELRPEDEPGPEDEPEVPQKPKRRGRVVRKIVKYFLFLVLAVAIVAAGGIGYLTVTEYRPAYAEDAQRGNVLREGKLTGGQTVRVLTLNTGYGGLDAGEDFFMDGGEGVRPSDAETVRQNMLGIEDLIRGADADFVMLQEVDTDSKRSYGYDQWRQYEFDLEDYESRFALNYSCDYVPYPVTEPIGRVHSGVATYSRYDITAATRYRLPCPFSWPVRIANLKRCLLVTRIPIDGLEQELVLVNLHLEAYDDGEGKEAQTAMLLQILQEEYAKGNYVIAGGDFNQSFPDGTDRYPIASGADWTPGTLGDLPAGWRYAWDSAAPTCRLLNQPYSAGSSGTQFYVIDGFILSPNVEPVSVRTQDAEFAVTDHNPVVLEARLVS